MTTVIASRILYFFGFFKHMWMFLSVQHIPNLWSQYTFVLCQVVPHSTSKLVQIKWTFISPQLLNILQLLLLLSFFHVDFKNISCPLSRFCFFFFKPFLQVYILSSFHLFIWLKFLIYCTIVYMYSLSFPVTIPLIYLYFRNIYPFYINTAVWFGWLFSKHHLKSESF